MAYNLVTKQPTTIALISVNMSSMDCNLLPELKQIFAVAHLNSTAIWKQSRQNGGNTVRGLISRWNRKTDLTKW